jgi:hypothetical protein
MAIFPMGGVLRRLIILDVRSVRLIASPCAALPIEKISHLQSGNGGYLLRDYKFKGSEVQGSKVERFRVQRSKGSGFKG